MEGSYRYVIHAYEDARQKRPMKGGPPSSPTALRRSDGPKCSPRSSPMDGSTSTWSTGGRRSRRRPRKSIKDLSSASIHPTS